MKSSEVKILKKKLGKRFYCENNYNNPCDILYTCYASLKLLKTFLKLL